MADRARDVPEPDDSSAAALRVWQLQPAVAGLYRPGAAPSAARSFAVAEPGDAAAEWVPAVAAELSPAGCSYVAPRPATPEPEVPAAGSEEGWVAQLSLAEVQQESVVEQELEPAVAAEQAE